MATRYELLGDATVRRIVDRFYDLMDADPSVKPLRDMHPPDLAGSREKLTLFLLGWTGGPQTYTERYGHPRLRARHLPFPIDDEAAFQWMRCMAQALEDNVADIDVRDAFEKALGRLAAHMRNRETPPPSGSDSGSGSGSGPATG